MEFMEFNTYSHTW